jgi:alkanesulfonate monooxygenase SsuD/methylene tetrahydromethanopterin reductase-like flavin-dependent oxidoreductase (luciferase family)
LLEPVAELFARIAPEARPGEPSAAWIDGLGVVGDPDRVAAGVAAYGEAGADAVVLAPPEPADAGARLAAAAHDLMRRVG